MSITFRCPCGESLAAEAEHAGMPVQCPTCEKVLTVPAAGSSAPPPPPRKMARLADDEEDDRPKKRKKKRRNYGDDDEPEHVRRLMARANADLDEEEARHRREGGGIAFTPGILLGAVTSPATDCQNMTNPTIRPVPVAVRISTALSLLWADLTGAAPRLIPLPLAIDWAKRHHAEQAGRWAGTELFEKAIDKIGRYLSQERARRGGGREKTGV